MMSNSAAVTTSTGQGSPISMTRARNSGSPSMLTFRVVELPLSMKRALLIWHCASVGLKGCWLSTTAEAPHWRLFGESLRPVIDLLANTDRLDEVTETSTCVMLDLLGWRGEIAHSSDFDVRQGRSERLAELTRVVGATVYLCGTGGARYLDERHFRDVGLRVQYVEKPEWVADGVWEQGRNLSALWAMMALGVDERLCRADNLTLPRRTLSTCDQGQADTMRQKPQTTSIA